MIDPHYYRDARLAARYHIQAIILERIGHSARARVIRVFRGPMRWGTVVHLQMDFPPTPLPLAMRDRIRQQGGIDWSEFGPPQHIFVNQPEFERHRFLEAFLDGDPPEIVMAQIKFLPRPTWYPAGDASVIGYDW